MEKIKIPTGYIVIDEYEKGKLETLSIGDYGKHRNVKADFLGYTKPINGVANGEILPLSEKWVITLSTQYGCAMKCQFCDCPNIPFNGNVEFNCLKKQVENAINVMGKVGYTERLNVHFARMGEPIFNKQVFDFAVYLRTEGKKWLQSIGLRTEVIHPVLTTSLPKNFKMLETKLLDWCQIKNVVYNGQAGLQLSINSTCDNQRNNMFQNMSISLDEISNICSRLPEPVGRKYCLNFAYASEFIIDAKKLSRLFDKNKFMVKITPIHNNEACRAKNIVTLNGYSSYEPYRQVEEPLLEEGFDVLVFVPSFDEENGCVTCGNAILAGSEIKL